MHEAHRLLEAGGGEHGAKRLAGLGRIDDQRLAGEVLLAVFPGLGEVGLLGDLGVRDAALEHGLLAREHVLVFRLAEQRRVIEHLFC